MFIVIYSHCWQQGQRTKKIHNRVEKKKYFAELVYTKFLY